MKYVQHAQHQLGAVGIQKKCPRIPAHNMLLPLLRK